MITSIRRAAFAVAAVAALAGGGVGIASAGIAMAAPATAQAHTEVATPAHTGWPLFCLFDQNFDWHYYNWCDFNYWHGSHFGDWRNHHDHNRDYDYNWRR